MSGSQRVAAAFTLMGMGKMRRCEHACVAVVNWG